MNGRGAWTGLDSGAARLTTTVCYKLKYANAASMGEA